MDKELTFYTKEQESKDDGRSYKDIEVENNVLVFFDNAENTGSIEWDRTLENGITYDRVIFDFQFKRTEEDPNSYILTFAQSHDLSELYAHKEFRDWMKAEHLANADHWSITEPEPEKPKGPTPMTVELTEDGDNLTMETAYEGQSMKVVVAGRTLTSGTVTAKEYQTILDAVRTLKRFREVFLTK